MLGEVISKKLPGALSFVLCGFLYVLINRVKIDYFSDKKTLVYIGLVFYFLGCICSLDYEKKTKLCELQKGTEIYFSGIVTDAYKKYNGRYRVRTSVVGEVKLNTYIIIETDEDIRLGYKLEGHGRYEPFMTATNYGQFDRKNYELGNGNLLMLDGVHIISEKRTILIIIDYLKKINEYICDLYDKWLPEDKASIAKAMVLGDKSDIDKDLQQLYQRSGIAHIIAISGLHIAMFGGTIYHLLRKLSGSYPVAAVLGITFILTYGILTGLSGATVRAIIMLILAITADVLGRKYDGITSITMALILMIVWNVNAIGQAGFLLSFGAVTGICLIYPAIKNGFGEKVIKDGLVGKVCDGLLVSISVQLATVPIIMYYYYEVPIYGIVLNILVVPLMSVLLLFLAVLAVGGYFSSVIAGFSSFIACIILNIYEVLCKLIDKLPFHILHMGRPKKMWMLLYYAIVILIVLALYKKKRNYVFGLCAIMIALFAISGIRGELLVNVFDVGQGDGIYIRTPTNDNILIDGGSSSKKNVGEYIIKNGIKYFGCDAIDYMIITHSDSDHFSGAKELLNDNGVEVRNLVLPLINNPDDEYRELQTAAINKGCNIYYISVGDEIVTGNVRFHCLNPGKLSSADKNQNSIVLWMKYDKFDMLFTGDIDKDVEDEILKDSYYKEQIRQGNSVEVLKVAHHGSATSTSVNFVNETRAKVSVISVGENNRYGHPSKDVVKRLTNNNSRVYMTKDDGAVTISTDGKRYNVDTYLKHIRSSFR